MNAQLVKIDTAAADLGQSVRKVFELAEGGSKSQAGLLWVFDLARTPKAGRRELRFWRPELQARMNGQTKAILSLGLDEVLSRILPVKRDGLHAGEVDQVFQIRPRTRIDYGVELPGTMKAGRNYYRRQELADFLGRRWLGQLSGVPAMARQVPASSSLKANIGGINNG